MIFKTDWTPEEELEMWMSFPRCVNCGEIIWAGSTIAWQNGHKIHTYCYQYKLESIQ